MKASIFAILATAYCASLLSFPAVAQTSDNAQINDRLSHIEHDLMLVQRQVAREGTGSSGSGDSDVPAGGSAQLEVRLSAIEDQLRELRGKVEESDNRTAKLAESFDKFQRDVDFRFNDMGKTQASSSVPTPAPAPRPLGTAYAEGNGTSTVTPMTQPVQQGGQPQAPFGGPTPAPAKVVDTNNASKEDTTVFSSPRELYNYAFRLLNQTQYEEASTVFDSFTKKYPKDPLVGNAFYWEGETYYIRRDYVNSADYFRQGFEAMPEGPKAADNLLKLAMSLDALSRDKEACLVLQQVGTKFKKTASSVADRADQEAKRIGCNK